MSAVEKHKCPVCGECRGAIADSRLVADSNVIRRRRYHCKACGEKWTTHEINVTAHGDLVSSGRRAALAFLRDVEKSARANFGDDCGRLFARPLK